MATMRQIRRHAEQTANSSGAFLWCSVCRAESSADPNDYWYLPDDYHFRHHGLAMQLVVKRVEIIPVAALS